MNHHRPVLQQRVQAHAVGDRGDHFIDRQHLEGADHEGVQREEEELHGGHDRHDPGQQIAMTAARGEDDDRGISRKQPAPEQQRAFLTAPPRRELEVERHVAIGVGGDIGEPVVAGEQAVDQDARSGGDQQPDRQHGALGAQSEKRFTA